MQLTVTFFVFIALTGITVCLMGVYFLLGVPTGVTISQKEYSTNDVKAIVEVSINDITIKQPLWGREAVSSDKRTEVSGNDVKNTRTLTERELSSVDNSNTLDLEGMFPLPPHFNFPQINAVRPISQVATMPWVQSLRLLLSKVDSKEINMVSANLAYKEVLVNWLISANVRSKIPLSKILVVALNSSLHRLLERKEIPSIYLPESLLSPHANFTRPYEKVMMMRLVILRLLNYWGFDVIHYDIDAIILKDPSPLLEKFPSRDIIGSVGTHPKEYYLDWGLSICLGFVMIRHTAKTEEYWNAMSETCTTSYDDQGQLNCGLKALHTHWVNVVPTKLKTTTIYGGALNGLRVSVMPYNIVCRLEFCQPVLRDHLYVWHKGGERTLKEKQRSAREGRTWFLRYHWKSIQNDFTGTRWLTSISYYFTTS